MSERNASTLKLLIGKVRAGGIAATGKQALHHGVESATHSGAFHSLGIGIGVTGQAMANVMMMGGIAAVSVIANQMEYYEGREQITEFYREELAAKNNKKRAEVFDAELTKAEKSNIVINGAVQRERSLRNLGIAASFIASVAVFSLVSIAFPGGLGAAALMSNATAAALVDFGSKAALGGLAYLAMKSPLMRIGTKLFGLDKETTHDMLVDMARDREQGKAISREQVVEVFVSANKQLSDYVESHFGRRYEELTLSDKVKVAGELANVLPIDKIAHSINLGVSNVSELAFTVQGDVSGVLPKTPEESHEPGAFERFSQRCKQMMHSIGGMFKAEKAHPIHTISEINKAHERHMQAQPAEESPIVELNEPSFAERVGSRKTQGKAFADRVQERRQQVLLDGSQTLQ